MFWLLMWHYVSLFDSISKLGYVMKLQKDTNDSSTLILWAHFHVSCKTVFNLTGSYYYIALVILRTSTGQYINRRNYKSEKWSNENFYRLSFFVPRRLYICEGMIYVKSLILMFYSTCNTLVNHIISPTQNRAFFVVQSYWNEGKYHWKLNTVFD